MIFLYAITTYHCRQIFSRDKFNITPWHYRALLTLPIAAESRENLATLKVAILDIMAACNPKYTAKMIQDALTFKVSDSTAHNMEVEEMVSIELGTEHVPQQLVCQTYSALMFNMKTV